MTNLKSALRALVKTPFVALVAVLSLALGIGADAAIFSLLHQLLLQPLPVHAPNRLVNLSAPGPVSAHVVSASVGTPGSRPGVSDRASGS